MRARQVLLGAAAAMMTLALGGCAIPGRAGAVGATDSKAAPYSTSDAGLVRSVQQALRDRGFDAGHVDGHWDNRTETALRRFQQANGLRPTGRLDERTASALGVWR
jgi:peptidoglycan hydrolase-like protein with peptidoglycan-binding domain